MRIEILAGSANPAYYPINKTKLVIGSDLSCDIVVAEDEISRKHMVLLQEGDAFYVVDQGSTNGSYLNEERLIPGRRVEFTSYFPVRLGSAVLMSLVSDEDAADEAKKIVIPFESSAPKKSPLPQPRQADKTSVISLKELQGSSTKNLVKKRDEIKKKTNDKNSKKKKKKSFQLGLHHIISILILAGAAYLTFQKDEADFVESIQVDKSTGKVIEPKPKVVEAPKPNNPTPPSFLEMLDLKELATKCSTPEELLLCKSIPEIQPPWGVVAKENNLFILIDVTSYWQLVLANLPPPAKAASEQPPTAVDTVTTDPKPIDPFEGLTTDQRIIYEKELWEITIGLFLANGIKSDDYLQLKGKILNFAFFLKQNELSAVKATIALTPESLAEVRRLAGPHRFTYIKESRAQIMNFRNSYYDINL